MHSPPVQPISASRSGTRLGGDDVAGDDDQQRRSSRHAGGPGVVGDHELAGRRRSRRPSAHRDRRAAVDPPSRACARGCARRARARRAAGRGRARRAARSPPLRLEHAGEVLRRSRAPRDLVGRQALERVGAQPLRTARRSPSQAPSWASVRGRPEPAAGPVVAVDAVGACELSELGHGVGGLAADLQRPGLAGQLRPATGAWPTTTGRTPPLRPDAPPPQMSCSSTTTSRSGRRLLEAERRPQADVAAADDRHVGARPVPRAARRPRRRPAPPRATASGAARCSPRSSPPQHDTGRWPMCRWPRFRNL